ncbi:glyoxalase [Spirosoma fluminis]
MTDRTMPLRPTIETESTAVRPAEQFQNQTLRPILKLLDSSLQTMWLHHVPKRKTPYERFNQKEKLAHIEQAVRQDTKLRLTLIGMVLGQFTADEWQAFIAEEAELTRRLIALLIQRLQSHVVSGNA